MLGYPESYHSTIISLFYQEVTLIKSSTQVGSASVGCGSNEGLLFRTFAVTVLVCLAYLVQLGLSLFLLVLYSRLCCLVPLGGTRQHSLEKLPG